MEPRDAKPTYGDSRREESVTLKVVEVERRRDSISARAALALLESLQGSGPPLQELASARVLEQLGYLTAATKEQVSSASADVALAKKNETSWARAADSLAQAKSDLASPDRRIDSVFHKLATWAGGGKSTEQSHAAAQVHVKNLTRRFEECDRIRRQGAAQSEWLSHHRSIEGENFRVTAQGKDLLSELAPRASVLGGISLAEAQSAIERLEAEIARTATQIENVKQAFKEAGYKTADSQVTSAIIRFATCAGSVKEDLKRAGAWDERPLWGKLSHGEKLHLIASLTAGGHTPKKSEQQLEKLWSSVASFHDRGGRNTYADGYVACSLLNAPDPEAALQRYKELKSTLTQHGVKASSGLFTHVASRLALNDDEFTKRVIAIAELLQQRSKLTVEQRMVAALALADVPGSVEAACDRYRVAQDVVKGSSTLGRLDHGAVASLAGLPGNLSPHLHVLDKMLNRLDLSPELALILYSGAMRATWLGGDLTLLQLMGVEYSRQKRLAIGDRFGGSRSSLASDSFSSSSFDCYDGLLMGTFSPSIGAACGAAPVSCDGGGHGASHSSCGSSGGDSGGHSSCGSSSSSSSCGGSSCGGGGGCGGGT